MEASQSAFAPLRIEMATSQIEGGQAIAWADPDRVIGCVAYSTPADAFDRFVRPNLGEKAGSDPAPASSSMWTSR